MPSLNVAVYIDEAVASARQQTIEDIEIICVDAGSVDGTRETIARHAAEDSRIRVIDSPIKSYGYQVNAGIDTANAEYIAILETDDHADPEMYGSLYDVAASGRYDYVKCDYDAYFTDDDGERIFSKRRVGRSDDLYRDSFVPKEHRAVAFDDWYLWNGIYSADFLRDNNIRFSETPGAAFQDIGFLHRTTSKARSVRYIDRSLYRYCVGRPEASSYSDKTISYIRQEYGSLFENIEEPEYCLIYRRLAKSLCRACMSTSDEYLASADAQEKIEWMGNRLIEGERRGYISSDILPSGLRETYSHVVQENDLLQYRRKRADDFRAFLGAGHPVVIFGCGIYGREARAYVEQLGADVSCFMDNAETLWSRSIDGVKVQNPQTLPKMPDDARYIVANENHAEEIAAQIGGYVDKNKIKIY